MTMVTRPYPTRVPVRFQGKRGQAALEQLRAVDRQRLVRKLGTVSASTALAVSATLLECSAACNVFSTSRVRLIPGSAVPVRGPETGIPALAVSGEVDLQRQQGPHFLLFGQRGHGPFQAQLAAFEHVHAVGQRGDEAQVLLRQQHGGAAGLQAPSPDR